MSLIGNQVEAFKAQAYQQGKFVEVSEQDLKGKWSVLFFYPADFTFVCPTELADLQEVYASDFKGLGVEVYSVSTDTHFVHKAWADATDTIRNITYTMIGDANHQLARQFGVLIESEGLADRGTFVIDPDGVVQIIEINPGGVGRDAKELLRKVKAAKYTREHPGEVCPAKWQEGSATLAPSLDLVGKL
jgi:peroxiredoxin (alkyl hydroperoxide reductase subunit C)